MRPPKSNKNDYERINDYDTWIPGVIEEIQLREDHDTGFKYPPKKEDGTPHPNAGKPVICDQVRLKFTLEGHQYPHYSKWMRYSYGEKSNLYLKYIKFLVEGAQPDLELDLDLLKKMEVKTMWTANGDWDNLEQIRPLGSKVSAGDAPEDDAPAEEVEDGPGVGE
jgi:hypothetical protein